MTGLIATWRTLHAFLVRDLVAQFGRHNIGFLWVVLEPMILCAGVAGMWYIIKPEYMHGVPVLTFVITGYMPLTLFRHLTGPFAKIFRRATPLMVHRQLDLMDIFISRVVVEFTGTSLAFMIIFSFVYFTGLAGDIADYRLVVFGWVLLALFSSSLAACIAAASEYSDAVAHFIPPLQYLSVPLAPIFYMVDWLPQIAQDALAYSPLSHPYEMIRAGFFGDLVETHYNANVTLAWTLMFFGIGFWCIEAVKDRLHDV